MTSPTVSVIIPTLNEEQFIARAIESAWSARASEVIVSDGGSDDRTEVNARRAGATKWVRSLPGRGTQQNAGAAVATHDILLFLHADGELTAGCVQQIAELKDLKWGAFEQQITAPKAIFRVIERGNARRVRWLGRVFGDQAIFVVHDLFRSVGGFPDEPLMEDVVLSKKLRRHAQPALLPGPVRVSPRRWESRGVARQTARNWIIQLRFALGASPEALLRQYQAK